jgi:hypothetical protein
VETDPYAVTASEQAAMSRRLEALVGPTGIEPTIDLTDRGSDSVDDAVEARLAAIEDTLDGLAERFEALLRDAATDGTTRLSGLEARLDRLHAAVVEGFGTELASLRSDLADALDEVRGQVESTVGAANSTIAATLDQHGAEAHSVLEAVQAEVKTGLTEMSRSLTGQFAAIRGVTGTLGGGTDRLVGAGQALLSYLGERDQWLERERDRMLHDVLDEFAQGLSGRGRRSLSSRMRNVVDRRRDARDAERFRSTQAEATVIEIPAMPSELAVLSEPVMPLVGGESGGPDGDLGWVKVVGPAQKSARPRKAAPTKAAAGTTAAKKVAPGRTPSVQNGRKPAATSGKTRAQAGEPMARKR